MTRKEAEQKIMEIIAKSAETDREVKEDTLLYEDLGLASVEVYVMLCELEEMFGVKISAAELRNVCTAGEISGLIIRAL